MRSWAKIKGAYVLSRRSIARIIAAIAAAIFALHAATAAPAHADEAFKHKMADAMCRILSIEDSLPLAESRVAVSDHVFNELVDVFFRSKPYLNAANGGLPPGKPSAPVCAVPAPPADTASSPVRRYPTRKAITVARAAEITGLSESTIKRLDKDPKNTNYPGRNTTVKILGAWARLHRESKLAAREVRAANRPRLGHVRS